MFFSLNSTSSFLFLLVFLSLPIQTYTTQFSFRSNESKNITQKSNFLKLSSLTNQVFGLSSTGIIEAHILLNLKAANDTSLSAKISVCQVSDEFVRDPSYQRRQSKIGMESLTKELADRSCCDNSDEDHITKRCCNSSSLDISASSPTKFYFSVEEDDLESNNMYILVAAICYSSDDAQMLNISKKGNVSLTNPNTRYPELGYEEALFPVLSAIVTALMFFMLLVLLGGLILSYYIRVKIGFPLLITMGATFMKAIGGLITFWYFYGVTKKGLRSTWYLYSRLLLASSSDILFIVVLMSLSSGYGVIPSSWLMDGRSPIFLVYIGVTLQMLIIIAVKLLFPFQYLGLLTYSVAGLVILFVATSSSYRHFRFLLRYGVLIEDAHIHLKSTPIRGLANFFIINIFLIALGYVVNIISVGIYDYVLNRPDLMWGALEIVDALLLTWYGFVVFPRKKSAFYVDMSNVSNRRLQQANVWRESQATPHISADGQTSAEPVEGAPTPPNRLLGIIAARGAIWRQRGSSTIGLQHSARHLGSSRNRDAPTNGTAGEEFMDLEAGNRTSARLVSEPQPSWISWSSGDSLPRPTIATWGGPAPVSRLLRLDEKYVPVLPSTIVVGSPCGESDSLKLVIGMPTAGPRAIPRKFDERGNEIRQKRRQDTEQRQPSALSSCGSYSMSWFGSCMIHRRGHESEEEREEREDVEEMNSVASNSCDGTLYTEGNGDSGSSNGIGNSDCNNNGGNDHDGGGGGSGGSGGCDGGNDGNGGGDADGGKNGNNIET